MKNGSTNERGIRTQTKKNYQKDGGKVTYDGVKTTSQAKPAVLWTNVPYKGGGKRMPQSWYFRTFRVF